MKILFETNAPLPAIGYGGTERVQFWLMKELVRLGHEVVLIGPKECEVSDFGIELIEKAKGLDFRPYIPNDVDIVHIQYSVPKGFINDHPVLVTCHGNGQLGEIFEYNTVFVSQKHAFNHGSDNFVYNGIDFDYYPFQELSSIEKRKSHFAFLAKASWSVKNLKGAVNAVKKSKSHLDVMGGRALSFSNLITSHGMVNDQKKIEVFRKCEALLFPVRWPEPFGIAVVEAFSQGIPAIVSPFGSLPELVDEDMGYVVNSQEQLIDLLRSGLKEFDSKIIREKAEKKYSSTVMARKYLSYYSQVIDETFNNNQTVSYNLELPPGTLLPF